MWALEDRDEETWKCRCREGIPSATHNSLRVARAVWASYLWLCTLASYRYLSVDTWLFVYVLLSYRGRRLVFVCKSCLTLTLM